MKETVLNRNGKVVIRPDSGDPVKIICGDPEGKTPAEQKGVVELLWDILAAPLRIKDISYWIAISGPSMEIVLISNGRKRFVKD